MLSWTLAAFLVASIFLLFETLRKLGRALNRISDTEQEAREATTRANMLEAKCEDLRTRIAEKAASIEPKSHDHLFTRLRAHK